MNIQNTFYYVQPMTKVQALNQRASVVDRNVIMTPYERQNAKMQLQAQREGLRQTVMNALTNDWAELRQEYQTLRREKTAAADRSEKRWDFQRLEYYRKSAHDFLQSADVETINARYEALDLSGDTHALRGFVEEGISALTTRKFTGNDIAKAVTLRGDMAKVQDMLTVTKEQKDLAAQGSILTNKVATLKQATEQAKQVYTQRDLLALQTGDSDVIQQSYEVEIARRQQFDGLGAGIQVIETVDNELVTHKQVVGLENWD